MSKTQGPVLIELDDPSPITPAEAPPISDAPVTAPAAMQVAAQFAARPASRLAGWFW